MSHPTTYRAAVARRFGPPEVLNIEDVAAAPLAAGQVRIAARYSGLNPVNARIRAGKFGGSVPYQPGTELLGEVVEVATGVTVPRVGDVVAAFGTPAANADLVTTTADRVVVVPDGTDLRTLAGVGAVGLTAITVLDALSLAAGSTIVVHGGAGGVGSVFVQLATAAGHHVVATASEANQDYLRSRGATPVVYGPGLAERLSEAAPEGFTAAVDMVGTHEAGDSAAAVRAAGGRAVTIVPETMQSHGLPLVQVRQSQENLRRLHAAITDGSIALPVATIAFEDIVEAHRRLDAGHARGKTVLDHRTNPNLSIASLREDH